MANLNYKGYEIMVNGDGEFNCPELELSADKYSTLCSRIDAESKREWERVKVLYRKNFHEPSDMIPAEATSVVESRYGGKMVWISYADKNGKKHREKVDARWLYLDSPENRDAFTRASKLQKQAERLREEAENCLVGLVKAPLPIEKKALA